MIYGNLLSKLQQNTVVDESVNEFDITSVVFEEYKSRKAMLEACTVEADRAVLEAQVSVLYEVSIKDILTAIKNTVQTFLAKVREFVETIIRKIKEFFEKRKKSKSIKILRSIGKGRSKVGESAFLIEESEEHPEQDISNVNISEDLFATYYWTAKSGSSTANFTTNNFSSKLESIAMVNVMEDKFMKIDHSKMLTDPDELKKYYDSIESDFKESMNTLKSLEYTVNKKYSSLYNAFASKEVFDNPDKYRSDFMELANFLADEGDINLPKAMDEIKAETEDMENMQKRKCSSLVKEIESGFREQGEDISHESAKLMASRTMNVCNKILIVYREIVQKLFNANNMITARCYKLSMFALTNNKKLGYLPSELIDEIKSHL